MKPDLPFVALAAGKHATNWQLAPQLAPGNHIGKHQRDTLPAALILKISEEEHNKPIDRVIRR